MNYDNNRNNMIANQDFSYDNNYNYDYNGINNGTQSIKVRDRLEDIFAYASDRLGNSGYKDSSNQDLNSLYDEDDLDDFSKKARNILEDEQIRKTKKITDNMIRNIQYVGFKPDEMKIIYSEILDTRALIAVKKFRNIISNPWIAMKVNHIDPIETLNKCRIVSIKKKNKYDKYQKEKKNKIIKKLEKMGIDTTTTKNNTDNLHRLTDYKDYLKKIVEHQIEIPERFDISNSEPYTMSSDYLPVKIVARYYNRQHVKQNNKFNEIIDTMGFVLLDLHSVRSKTMICFHISTPSKRDGIIVTDQISFSTYTAICMPNLSQYLVFYGTTLDYKVYHINNPVESLYYHISYALLEPELQRMVFYSVYQIFHMVNCITLDSDKIKKVLTIISGVTEIDILKYDTSSSDSTSTSTSSDSDEDDKDSNKRKIKPKIKYHLTRMVKVFAILDILGKKNITISECFTELWPKLNMISCEITGHDRLPLREIGNLLDVKRKGITIYSPVYAIAETVVGYNLECKQADLCCYVLDPSQAFFEFIPIDDIYFNKEKNELKTKSFRHLEKGCYYELVVSSIHTNTIRQMTNEIIKIVGYDGPTPVIKPICRELDMIYFRNMSQSKIIMPVDIEDVLIESKLNVMYYGYRKENRCYKFYVELRNMDYDKYYDKHNDKHNDKDSDKYSDKDVKYSLNKNAKESRVKYRLEKLLIPVENKTDSCNIMEVEVRIVEPGTFNLIKSMRIVDSVDPSRIRVGRRLIDDREISIIKNSIVYQY